MTYFGPLFDREICHLNNTCGDNTCDKAQCHHKYTMKNCYMSLPKRACMGLGRCYCVEAKVFRGVLRICEEEYLVVEANLSPIVSRCLNLEIIDGVLTRLHAQGFAYLLHVEFELAHSIDADNGRPSGDRHIRFLAHHFRDDVAFHAGAHGDAAAVGLLV